jgi:malonyl-CoA/methylmalonyl-CoA synthetase
MSQSLTEQLLDAFVTHAQRPCLRIPGANDWTYGEVDRLSANLAGLLRDLGLVNGDRVLVQVDKSAEAMALYLACLRTGVVYVPINTAYTSAEVAYFLADAQPRLFVCRPSDEGVLASVSGDVAMLTLGDSGDGSLMDRADEATAVSDVPAFEGSDIAAIIYTSGTTGRSKGAMVTQENLLSNARTLLDYWGWQDGDVLLHALPIFHVHGLFVSLHWALLSGTPMLFLPRFNVDEVLRALPESTVMMGVPTFYTRLLDHSGFNADACSNMRLFISGSAPLTEQTFQAWEECTGQKILERYGMSETAIISSNPLSGERVAGSVGFVLPGIEARIADPTGEILAAGEVGIIEVRGPNVFKGYWQMPEKTAEEFRDDGFFITGDMGRMDAEGRIFIVGRQKDLVISGGYNVYPKEVEKLIDEIPAVLESAVIGVPHPDFGEGVVAVVVPGAGEVSEDDIAAALDGKLARFKQPKRVINVAELPRNTMGKVQKNELRQRYGELFS